MSTATDKKLTPRQREALAYAAKHGHVFSHVPNSRYSGFWEMGKYHFRVVDNLLERGLLKRDHNGIACITDAGREAAEALR